MATTVPTSKTKTQMTFRQRWKRWTKPPRRLTLTRAGKFFMLLTLGVGAGALNTGNNLLFLLLGMMLSAIIASGILSEGVLRKLRAQRRLPKRLFARTPAPGGFRIDNKKAYISLNIELSELNPTCTSGPLNGEEIGLKDISWWKFWLQDVYEDHRYVAIARAFELEPNQKMDINARYIFPERGAFHLPGLRFSTRFPFGLFHKVAEFESPTDIVVFPEAVDAEDWVSEVAAKFGDMRRNRAGSGEEYFGLRDWRTGEDPRNIHWKASARRNNYVVREFEEEEQRAVQIIFVPAAGHQSIDEQLLAKFEWGLSKTVGLLQTLNQQNYRIGLSLPAVVLEPQEGHTHLDRMLRALATVECQRGIPKDLRVPPPQPGPYGQNILATIGVGFADALMHTTMDFDLTLELDELLQQELT